MNPLHILELLAKPHPTPQLTWNEALSGIFGSISLAAWFFLLVPQLIENYRLQSAEGISLLFICVWFVGDVTNLVGAAWAGLVPTVIALAVYFCLADAVLILQCCYYNWRTAQKAKRAQANGEANRGAATAGADEHEPLLRRSDSSGLPGSYRRRSSAASSAFRRHEEGNALGRILEEAQEGSTWWHNTLSVLAIAVVGTAGWAIAWSAGVWKPAPENRAGAPGQGEGDMGDLPMAIGAQVLGYASAVCYLGARIPQIIKNQRNRSTEGLSLLFFILSLVGNATYAAGILFHSIERHYILTNLPWLIGSLGTMFEDAIIFAQFSWFKHNQNNEAVA